MPRSLDGDFVPTINGTSGNDTLNGTAEDDIINGLEGDDQLNGGDGGDTLNGGAGSDVLDGGAGNDVYYVDVSGDTVTEDAGEGTDEVRTPVFLYILPDNVENLTGTLGARQILVGNALSNTIIGGAGNDTINGEGGADTMIGGAGNDLYGVDDPYDVVVELDGGGNDEIETTLAYFSIAAISGVENLVGSSNSGQTLIGSGTSNFMQAGEGNDTLDGGAGADSLNGGKGDDIYIVDDFSDQVWEQSSEGIDQVRSDLSSYVLNSNVENLLGTSNLGQSLGGNELNNVIVGGTGNDMLEGGGGDDTLDGGAGNDTASYASASDWVGVNLSSAGPLDTVGAGIDTLVSIENLVGSAFSDILSGNDGANRLEGGAGFDVLIGGLGNDMLDGGEGEDEAHYQSAPSAVNINLALTGAQNTGGAGVDTLVSIERVRGSEYNDVLRGDAADNGLVGEGGDDWLFGGAGNDALNGAAGFDRMYGGTGNDRYSVSDDTDFVYELAGEGQDVVLAWVDHQLRDNVEDLILMMNGTAVIGKGNALDNWLTGNDGTNKLYGYDGNDGLNGNGGDDWLFGGNGDDYLVGLAGYDRMYGGAGNDIYAVTDTTDYAYENANEGIDRVNASINYTLRANIENLQLDGSGDLRGYGNAENNIIDGNAGNNLLYGRDGNDDLRGHDGNDILYGENGNDRLQGNGGQDRLYGGAGADLFLFRDNDFAGMTSGTADRIHDFSQADGDRILLNEVDANTLVGGIQPFAFIGSGNFTGTVGELRYQQISGNTYVMGDTNGDGAADFWIRLDGLHTLGGWDLGM